MSTSTDSVASSRSLFLIAGEPSGDQHGAELIRCLKRQDPELRILGAGGGRMAAAGQEQCIDLAAHAVVGLVEVAKHYPQLRRLFHQTVEEIARAEPGAVCFIDYPGFNLRLAAVLRRRFPKLKLIYYISPQVWAWKSGRAKTMAKLLDLLIVLFEFEKSWFAQAAPSLRVEWCGHPIFDRLVSLPVAGGNEPGREAQLALAHHDHADRIALLPGSREAELRKHFPILIETARILVSRRPHARFIWIAPDQALYERGMQLLHKLGGASLPLECCTGYSLTHLHRCDLALLASGTVSLECAVLGVPQVVFYRVNPLTYEIGKRVVKVQHVSMVNLLAPTPVVPEFVQADLQPDQLAQAALHLLEDEEARRTQLEGMALVRRQLGEPGASGRVASLVLRTMGAS